MGRGGSHLLPVTVSQQHQHWPWLGKGWAESRQRRQAVGLLDRDEAACLDPGVSGLLGASVQPVAWERPAC